MGNNGIIYIYKKEEERERNEIKKFTNSTK